MKWRKKRLGDVADLCLGKMLDQNKNRGEPMPYLANVNVRWGEPLHLAVELTNPATGAAIQVQTEDYHMIGWAPRYLLGDLINAMAGSPGGYTASVVRVNPVPAPSKQRVLIELNGHLPLGYLPMSGPEFPPLV